MSGALVIGYGNALRTDDGVGPLAASLLAHDIRARGIRIMQRHQLTPELAIDLAAATRVVLIDARAPERWAADETDERVPRVAVQLVEPARADGAASSHHLDPETLLALTRELYGCAPQTWLVSVLGASFDVGEDLSTCVREVLPEVVETCLVLAEDGRDA
jgi:hydrogenase maturation protease